MRRTVPRAIALLLASILPGCAADDPLPTDSGVDALADASPWCATSWALPDVGDDHSGCARPADDYRPGSGTDGYPPCVSDDGSYHPFEHSIGSIGRVAAFEKIAALLLRADGAAPSRQAFVDARLIYVEAEGLDSRVSRREDEHYPAAATACADMTAEQLAQHPHRCVGPARIQPLLNQALADGSTGEDPLLNAARVEAALLWFLYVSVHKEALTCTEKRKDCDSSYAYYTGGEPRASGAGLARYVRAVSPATHDAAFDGLLAVRCWRDLDPQVPAADLPLRDRAIDQFDRALLRGLALIARSRLVAVEEAVCDEARRALWTGVQVLGRALDREATARDPTRAAALRTALATGADQADGRTAGAAIDAIFPCPF